MARLGLAGAAWGFSRGFCLATLEVTTADAAFKGTASSAASFGNKAVTANVRV